VEVKEEKTRKKTTEGGDDEVRKTNKGKTKKGRGKKAKGKPRLVEITVTFE
jgi:hypothetical protein